MKPKVNQYFWPIIANTNNAKDQSERRAKMWISAKRGKTWFRLVWTGFWLVKKQHVFCDWLAYAPRDYWINYRAQPWTTTKATQNSIWQWTENCSIFHSFVLFLPDKSPAVEAVVWAIHLLWRTRSAQLSDSQSTLANPHTNSQTSATSPKCPQVPSPSWLAEWRLSRTALKATWFHWSGVARRTGHCFGPSLSLVRSLHPFFR